MVQVVMEDAKLSLKEPDLHLVFLCFHDVLSETPIPINVHIDWSIYADLDSTAGQNLVSKQWRTLQSNLT